MKTPRELRGLAEAATPGPWRRDADGCCVYPEDENVDGPIAMVRVGGAEGTSADAKFIAALDPPTAIALLDALEASLVMREAISGADGIQDLVDRMTAVVNQFRIATDPFVP